MVFLCLHQIPKPWRMNLLIHMTTLTARVSIKVYHPCHGNNQHPSYNFDALLAMRSTTHPIKLLDNLLQTLYIPHHVCFWVTYNPNRFLCDITIGGKCTFRSRNYAKTYRAAQEDAAEKALDFLFRCPSAFYNEERARSYDMLPLIPSEIPHGSYILALRELCRLNGYGKPTYAFEDTLFEDEQRCRISINTSKETHKLEYGTAFRTKRDAKKDAAMTMFLRLVELSEGVTGKTGEREGPGV